MTNSMRDQFDSLKKMEAEGLNDRIAKARDELRAASEGRWAEGCLTEHQLDWRAGMFAAGLRLARLLEERDAKEVGEYGFSWMDLYEKNKEALLARNTEVYELTKENADLKRQLAEREGSLGAMCMKLRGELDHSNRLRRNLEGELEQAKSKIRYDADEHARQLAEAKKEIESLYSTTADLRPRSLSGDIWRWQSDTDRAKAIATARAEALESAAKVCDDRIPGWEEMGKIADGNRGLVAETGFRLLVDECRACAARIRALKDQPR